MGGFMSGVLTGIFIGALVGYCFCATVVRRYGKTKAE